MSATPADLRRTDLDWLRIGAFGLLILYHVGVFYTPAPFAVGAWSPRPIPWLVVPMLALNPWRLLLLFVISGAATRFMADRLAAGALFASRSARLLIPLLFGMAVIVPPQAFVQVLERYGYHGGFLEFWGRYLSGDHGFCNAAAGCVILPTWNHLWFVAYLWAYTVLLCLVLFVAPKVVALMQRGLERLMAGPGLVLFPALWLVLAKAVVEPAFPRIGAFVDDGYAHAIYLPGFLLGFLLARSDAIWTRIEAMRRGSLAAALGAWATIIALGVIFLGPGFDWVAHATVAGAPGNPYSAPKLFGAAVWGFDQWFWILAAFGFARRHLSRRDGPARRYLTEAVFPFYIIHQTTIEVVGHYLAPHRLPLPLEAALIIGLTAASCWVGYEVVRRVPLLRPLFGLKPAPRPASRPAVLREAIVFNDIC